MNHTPGPWTVGCPAKTHYIMTGGHTVVAALPHDRGNGSHYVIDNDSERKANASLIAAAPELLEALELFANLDRNVPSDRWWIETTWCEQARKAIAKAKGE